MDEFLFASPPLTFFIGTISGAILVVAGVWWVRRKSVQFRETLESRIKSYELQSQDHQTQIQELKTQIRVAETRVDDSQANAQSIRQDFERRLMERENELRNRDLMILDLEKRRTELESHQERRVEEYNKQIRSLVQAREDLNEEKSRVREEAARRQDDLAERRKVHWQNHEKLVVETLKSLSARLSLVCFDQETFPLARKPDCAVEIGDQIIVFDAKAPADPSALDYFPEYLRRQAEGLEKYLKQEGVRREGFLVVPTDVISHVKDRLLFEINGFRIHVVAPESLETILRLFLKIQEFEILETVDPQAQEDLAEYIGRASRVMKRKIHLDQFMNGQLLEVLISADGLPHDILEKAKSKERAYAINPPRLDRGKNLNLPDLIEEQRRIGESSPNPQ